MRARTPREGIAVSTRTSRAELSAAEEQLERSIASGSKSLVNGIAFPSEVARRLQRASNVATKDTFIVSCFVDVVLDPPHRAPKPERESSASPVSKGPAPLATKKSQRIARVGFNETPSEFGAGLPTFASDFDSLVSPQAGGRGAVSPFGSPNVRSSTPAGTDATQPLHEQLHCIPKGPYQVRLPTSATVAECATMIQNALRDIQARERHDMAHALKEHGKPLLYAYSLASCEEIAARRLASSSKAAPSRSPPQQGLGAPRRGSMLGGGRLGLNKRRPSATPDVTSLTPAQGSTPALRGMTLDPLFTSTPSHLTNEALAKVKSTSPDDVNGANMVSISSLASLTFDIPRAGDVMSTDALRVKAASDGLGGAASQSLSFNAFTAFIGDDNTPPLSKIERTMTSSPNTLMAPSLSVSCAAAFAHRRFTVRPCDPFGRVLKLPISPHLLSLGSDSTLLLAADAESIKFEPATKPFLKCFPAGTTTFHACLSIDGTFHREEIRALFQANADAKAEQREIVELQRQEALEEKEAAWAEHDRQTVMNSILRDRSLREHSSRPTATESYKAFLKEEATEEYDKQKQRRLAEALAYKESRKSHFRATLKALYAHLLELDRTEASVRFELNREAEAATDAMLVSMQCQLDRLFKRRRVGDAMTRVRLTAERAAQVAGESDIGAEFKGL